jgi:hypothetical protein
MVRGAKEGPWWDWIMGNIELEWRTREAEGSCALTLVSLLFLKKVFLSAFSLLLIIR